MRWLIALVLASGLTFLPPTAVPAGDGAAGGKVTVFAAASLTEVFRAMAAPFGQQNAGTAVELNCAASSLLAQQIIEGAPADVFASADEANMQRAASAEALAGAPRVFATNRLAIAVAPGNPKHIGGLRDLGASGLTLALAAPAVPAGRYAAEAFAKAGVPVPPASQEIDVRAVLNKVAMGEADAGIVYVTDIRIAAGKVEAVAIPDAHNVLARYPIAVLAQAANPPAARAFVQFVLSPAGQSLLRAAGFSGP